jgi:hypothetical protein
LKRVKPLFYSNIECKKKFLIRKFRFILTPNKDLQMKNRKKIGEKLEDYFYVKIRIFLHTDEAKDVTRKTRTNKEIF